MSRKRSHALSRCDDDETTTSAPPLKRMTAAERTLARLKSTDAANIAAITSACSHFCTVILSAPMALYHFRPLLDDNSALALIQTERAAQQHFAVNSYALRRRIVVKNVTSMNRQVGLPIRRKPFASSAVSRYGRCCHVTSVIVDGPIRRRYGRPLPADFFPSTVTDIVFGSLFAAPLLVGSLPAALTQLSFAGLGEMKTSRWNHPIAADVLPPSLTSLTFNSHYNQPITASTLPHSLRTLHFGMFYNQKLHHLPPHLTELTLGYVFPQDVVDDDGQSLLPATITRLSFVHQCISVLPPIALPPSLLALTVVSGLGYTSLAVTLPPTLTELSLRGVRIPGDPLPQSLRSLQLMHETANDIQMIPAGLTTLRLGSLEFVSANSLPMGLLRLHVDRVEPIVRANILPQSLTELTIDRYYSDSALIDLPSSLTKLTIHHHNDQLNINHKMLPQSIQQLSLRHKNYRRAQSGAFIQSE